MACCINVACICCTLCIFIGLTSLIQICLGIYLNFIQKDVITVNRLVKTDRFDSYLLYILLVFMGLGIITLALSFFSIYSVVRRLKSLSVFVAILWIFSMILNLIMFIISFLYYFLILPQLRSLLTRTLQQHPFSTSNLLDDLQLKYTCCGFHGKDDYHNLSLDPFPSSCCRIPNCWRDTDINNHIVSNTTISLMHSNGCYSIMEKYLTVELWILAGVAGLCALLQFLALTFLCTLYQRYKKFDDNPNFTISHLAPMNGSDNQIQSSSQTIEITQI